MRVLYINEMENISSKRCEILYNILCVYYISTEWKIFPLNDAMVRYTIGLHESVRPRVTRHQHFANHIYQCL